MFDDEYTKSHYKLRAVYLGRQKELDADSKSIQQKDFVRKLKNTDGENVHNICFL